MKASPDRREARLCLHGGHELECRGYGGCRLVSGNHDRIADGLHQPGIAGQRGLRQLVESCGDLRRVLVAVRLGQGGEAGQIGKQDGDLSCVHAVMRCSDSSVPSSFAELLLSFHDQLAAQHAHLALELELTGLVGHELDRHGLAFGQFGALPEVGDEHHL